MSQEGGRPNILVKILTSAMLVSLVAIASLLWQVYSSHSEEVAMATQVAKQNMQIARQDI